MKIKKFVMLVASFVLSAACIFGAACTPAGSGTGGTGGGNTQQGDTGNEDDDDKTEDGDTDGESDKDDGTEPETPVTPNPDPGEGDGQEDEDDPTVTPTPDPGEDDEEEDPPVTPTPDPGEGDGQEDEDDPTVTPTPDSGEDDEEEDPPVTPTPDPGEDDEENPPVEVSETLTFGQAANESAAFEWTDSSASLATVMYRPSGTTAYTAVDEELIRQISATTARVDVLGLKGNSSYDFRIETSDKEIIEIADVHISAYDRSGYAHFGATSGVGAYSNDGTLKSGAQVIYVTEETKNTVTATINGKEYEGLVEILQNARRTSNPIDIRIIGTISAATWNQIDYNADNKYNSNNKLSPGNVIGANGEALPQKNLTQEEIISGGYNSLNTKTYSQLNGLTNRIKFDSSKNEFDSYYNMCDISDAENVTVEGVGEDAEIFQWGFTWKNCSSIEVRNLAFDDYTEDACSFEASTNATTLGGFDSQRIWVHHNTVNEGINYWDVCSEQDKHDGDGGTDFKRAEYITVSYNHYVGCHKTGLVGGGDDHTTASITFHHNWYENCKSRLPLGRQANMHMYNNYYDGSTSENMSLRAGAYAFIENCYFDNAKNPITTKNGDDKRGVAKVYNCTFAGESVDTDNNNVTIVSSRTQTVDNDNIFDKNFDTNSSTFYYANGQSDVEIMHKTSEVPTVVPQLAGTLHRDSNIEGGTSQPGGTEENPSTPGGDTDDEEQEQPTEPSVQKELFKAEDLKGNIANGDIIYDGENISVQFTENKATLTTLNYSDGVSAAVANDGSGLTFSKMILPNGSTCNYIITANKSCTVTVYYTCTDKSWANSSTYGKSGILMVNGTLINEDSATAGNKLSGTAYAYTFTVTAGQTYTLSSSSNRLVLFGISSS